MVTGILVSDFDGTMTARDFYSLVRERWWQKAEEDPWQDYLDGRCTHFDALNRFFARIDCDETGLMGLVDGMRLDPGLAESVARLRAAGWEVEVASAGCAWYIERLLAHAGVALPVHANPGRLLPGGGLRMEPPAGSPFFHPGTGIGKAAVVVHHLARGLPVAYAGDGPPDAEPCALVPERLRFAKDACAGALAARGLGFRPFSRWSELPALILEREP